MVYKFGSTAKVTFPGAGISAIATSKANIEDMKKQMNALSSLGLLSRFVGMLTDSRSFLSYPRHEYFRRILCNLIGEDIQNGKLPKSEMEFMHQMVKDISYNNADRYFNF